MTKKMYTLELTAEELEAWRNRRTMANGGIGEWAGRVDALAEQARADREADDLRLPWVARTGYYNGWRCTIAGDPGSCAGCCDAPLERRAKLMSAAPELLEAVRMVLKYCGERGELCARERKAIDRALRKVETGLPE